MNNPLTLQRIFCRHHESTQCGVDLHIYPLTLIFDTRLNDKIQFPVALPCGKQQVPVGKDVG